ncbi:MAG TPA: sigma-70 family RNA polymerase sigma factor [Spirochaetota bacterium]|nr:sigma-70 family RNA polymerase sigma factor [Spirochaetota bacterium]
MEPFEHRNKEYVNRLLVLERACRGARRRLIWLAHGCGLDAFSAEDVVQECFLSVTRSIHRLDCSGSLVPYLEKAVLRAARRCARRMGRQRYFEIPDADPVLCDTGREYPDASLPGWESGLGILACVSTMEREILLARYRDHIRVDELAGMFGVSRRTCLRRINQAKNSLAKVLALDAEGEARDVSRQSALKDVRDSGMRILEGCESPVGMSDADSSPGRRYRDL